MKYLVTIMISFAICSWAIGESLNQGIACNDWFSHLAKDHNVWLVSKTHVKNANFQYHDIPNSKFVIATPLDQASRWKLKIGPSGGLVDVNNGTFGYVINLKNDQCVNTSGYELINNKKQFNYDWTLCEELKRSLSKSRQKIDDALNLRDIKNTSIEDHFKFMSLKEKKIEEAYQAAFNSLSHDSQQSLYKMVRQNFTKNQLDLQIDMPKLFSACDGQNRFIESDKKTQGQFSSPQVNGAR